MEKLLTPKELSELLSVKLSTIYHWTHLEFIPYVKIGRFIRFRESEVLKWLIRREYKGRATKKIHLSVF